MPRYKILSTWYDEACIYEVKVPYVTMRRLHLEGEA